MRFCRTFGLPSNPRKRLKRSESLEEELAVLGIADIATCERFGDAKP